MLSITRTVQRFLPQSRVASRLPSDPLDEFASEPLGALVRRPAAGTPQDASGRGGHRLVGVGVWSMTGRETR